MDTTVQHKDTTKKAGIKSDKSKSDVPPKSPKPEKPAGCSTVVMRSHRAEQIGLFLRNAFKLDADDEIFNAQLKDIRPTLMELNALDVIGFVSGYKFKVGSYFWLTGNNLYWEAVLWSLIGVFTSLIYYVSKANGVLLGGQPDDDIGPFDRSQISGQVAKMFYAPVVTAVVVLGFSLVLIQKQVGVDISVNHGLIIFSFIAGFYSGRLMKLLDKLKTAVFPDSPTPVANAGSGDITVRP
jgi:hypothetical protein